MSRTCQYPQQNPGHRKGVEVRVVDESGEDYAYSADRFFTIDVPLALEEALFAQPTE